ncbi:MAG: DUF1566 domain-containing protein [Candidatus Magnetomorum sp.]|nr:DUF1566 domain-containing protein [Candidatus Magnetomorum sp.]
MKNKPIIFIFVILLVGWIHSIDTLQANPLPDTGAEYCHNQTQVITCPQAGEPFYGQDAHYTINPHQFVKFDAQGQALTPSVDQWSMVLDQATGLMWEVKTTDGSLVDRTRKITWYSSQPDLTASGASGKYNNGENTELYIQALNNNQFGSFSDWRLPDIMELKSIVDIASQNPSIYSQFFPFSQALEYWTTQTLVSSVSQAWCIHFYDGHEETQEKGDLFYVRAVRSMYPQKTGPHLLINPDNTITDIHTGLMWQRQIASYPQAWEYALENCENLVEAGFDDWRMPTVLELHSIVNYNRISPPAIDPLFFPETMNNLFWTSTPSQTPGYIYNINFATGISQSQAAQGEHYYRAVRGGHITTSENVTIQSPSQAGQYTIGSIMSITWESLGMGDYVRIELSRQAGRSGTFEMIDDAAENKGQYEWNITPPASGNCSIRIIPLQYSDKQNSLGLFSIVDTRAPKISSIASTSTLIDHASHSIEYTVSDSDGGPLMVIADSSNTALIPLENIGLGSNSPFHYAVFEYSQLFYPKYLTITPTNGQSGTAMITLTVYDSGLLSSTAVFQVIVGDMRSALIQLYQQTNGNGWINQSGWKTPPLHDDDFGLPQTECSWKGITCDSYGQVIRIDLNSNQLNGTLPIELGNLKALVYLNLSNNQLSGELPANLSLLKNLQELRLNNNALTGTMPQPFFQLPALQVLQLNDNQFKGELPHTIDQMQSLLSLNISHNQFSGSFPQGILSLVTLQQLDISHNYLSGSLPQGLSYLTYLQIITIAGNQFSGELPSDIKYLSMLGDHQSDFRYNLLTTQEQDLAAFISSKQIDTVNWQNTQTVAPSNLNAFDSTSDKVHFSWTPIEYTSHEGGYEICCANYIGAADETCKIINDKTISSYEFGTLKPETTYYCHIRSFTLPNTDNPNQLYSEFSEPLTASTQKQEIIWNIMESKTNNWLNTVWGTSSSNVFTVGNDSLILHYDGSGWSSMTSTTQNNLHSVFGLSETDIVAAGADGTLLQFNGSQWKLQPPVVDTFLWALWGVTDTLYAAGSEGTLLKRTNNTWQKISSNTSVTLRDIWGSAQNDIFVVGGQGTILHYNGTAWVKMESNTVIDLRCVFGFSSNNVYAAGYNGTILHYNGVEWTPMNTQVSVHIMDIWGANANSLFAVGENGTILYNDGSGWIKMESGTTNYLRSIWGSTATDVFTVGYDGTILRLGSSMPFISFIPPQETFINIEKKVQFIVRSTMTSPDKLGLSARSTNQTLIPGDSEHLAFQGVASTRYLIVRPMHNQYGESDISITVRAPNGLTVSTQFHMTVHNQIVIPTEERQVLEALYHNTNGNYWRNNDNWMGDLSTECSWYGVVCENNAHVIKLILPENNLSGTLPQELGNIPNLNELDMHGNTLTGVLPTHIGDLINLDKIDLSDNLLTGNLPSEWGNIEGLLLLKLDHNQLSGTIPSTIGNMQYLQSIRLESNLFSGSVPVRIKRLPFILEGQSDFRYNALYSSDVTVKDFLKKIQQGGDWESTQTIAPASIKFNTIGAYAISLSWNTIPYMTNEGGYEVFYADDPNGLFRIAGPTSNKQTDAINVTGLLPETGWYFKVRTLTRPHADNANTVYSDFSTITSTTTKDPASLPLWKNGSFETTDFYGWTITDISQSQPVLSVKEAGESMGTPWDQFFPIEPTDGNFAAVYAFSGLPGTAQLSQELYIPAGGATLSFDYRMGWDMITGSASQAKRFQLSIYPENSDTPLMTRLIKQANPNTRTLDTGIISETIDVSDFACQSIRISFELSFPTSDTSPGLFLLDNIRLVSRYSNVLEIFLPDAVTEGDAVLENAGKIQLPKSLQQDVSIHLAVSDTSIIIPAQVIIPKGQKSAYFNIGVSDDTFINGRRSVVVSVEDVTWAACDKSMWISDNDDAWQQVYTGIQSHLFSVWGRSANDVYAVGNSGQIIHFDGTDWRSLESGTQSNLNAIWGNDNQLYAVGDDGTLLSYENDLWIQIDIPFTTRLTGIWGANDTIFAAGTYGVLLEKSSNDWIAQTSMTPSDISVILGGNTQSIYMISQSGVHNYTSGDWIPISIPVTPNITDMQGSENGQWILVGDDGMILYKKSSDWQTGVTNTSMQLNAATVSEDVFYAVGNSGTILRSQTLDSWIAMNAQSTQHLNDVWAASKDNVFAVGDNGTILRYSGPDIQGIQDAESYVAGEILTVANMISFPSHVTAITLCVNMPQEWSYKSTDANARVVLGHNNDLVFTWTGQLLSPMIFNYRLNVPKHPAESIDLTAKMIYRLETGNTNEKEMLPSPLVLQKGTLKYDLNIILDPTDGGYVSGSGLMCPPVCSRQFDTSETIQINASPVRHYEFMKWLDTETNAVLSETMMSLTLSQNKTFQVIFQKNQAPKAPEISYPSNFEILDTAYAVHFELMPFIDPENDAHQLTEWRIHRADRPADCKGIFLDNCVQSDAHYLTQYTQYNLISGMQYVWDVGYMDAGSETLVRSKINRFTIGLPETDNHITINPGLDQVDYQMICLPLWLENPSAPEALKNTIKKGYDTRYMKIGRFDPILNQYAHYNTTMEITPGKAFWVLSRNAMPFSIHGVRVSTAEAIDVPLIYSPDHKNGWNMIGSPNIKDYYWDLLVVVAYNSAGEMINENGQIVQESELKTIGEWGQDNPFLESQLWRWEKGAYYESSKESSYYSKYIIHAYNGYWVCAKQSNVWLRFPVNAQVRLKRTQITDSTDQWALSDGSSSPPAPMQGFDTATDISKGCFVSAVRSEKITPSIYLVFVFFLLMGYFAVHVCKNKDGCVFPS